MTHLVKRGGILKAKKMLEIDNFEIDRRNKNTTAYIPKRNDILIDIKV